MATADSHHVQRLPDRGFAVMEKGLRSIRGGWTITRYAPRADLPVKVVLGPMSKPFGLVLRQIGLHGKCGLG